jgi:hypothetical protein
MEPEIIPPHDEDAGISGFRVRMAHVQSLGLIGALLALLTMGAAVGFGLIMLFGRSLLAAAVVVLVWPYIFSAEFTRWVFGADSAPFWKVFLLIAVLSALTRTMRIGTGRK